MKPRRVTPWFREMPWGATALEPWFPRQNSPIGEVWFRGDDEPLPILVKFIFTAGRLSVQVHPGDQEAQRLEGTPGKTEMWHILRAEPGARIALGLREPASRERLRQAALAGEIEPLLNWIAVGPGETYFIYPGTIHTIGPGVTLCEIQQHRDLTYRLYDYGRPRELHLEKALPVADLNPHPGRAVPAPLGEGRNLLASCQHFATELWEFAGAVTCQPVADRLQLLVTLEGEGRIAGEPFAPGQVWLIPAGAELFRLEPRGPARLLSTYVPQ
jgi:mannose-6-phosphate isomerase